MCVDLWVATYVKKSLALLSAQVCVRIAENETNGGEEVTFAGTIAADNDIVFGRKGLDDGLILVAAINSNLVMCSIGRLSESLVGNIPLEALDDNLLDIHLGERATRLSQGAAHYAPGRKIQTKRKKQVV